MTVVAPDVSRQLKDRELAEPVYARRLALNLILFELCLSAAMLASTAFSTGNGDPHGAADLAGNTVVGIGVLTFWMLPFAGGLVLAIELAAFLRRRLHVVAVAAVLLVPLLPVTGGGFFSDPELVPLFVLPFAYGLVVRLPSTSIPRRAPLFAGGVLVVIIAVLALIAAS